MKQNQSYVSDFYYAIQVSISLLKPIGAWPLRQQATIQEIIIHGVSISIAIYYEILRTACPLIFTVTVFLRYLLLLSHRDEIKSCIDRIAEDWRNVTIAEDRQIMLANAKSGRFFGMISTAFMFGSGIPYTCMPLVLPPIITEDNVTIRSFPNPCELVFVNVSPVYEIAYVLVALACLTAYTVFCGICSLTAKFVTHICGQCEILMCIFEELIDGGNRNRGTVDQRISTAIIYHLRILNLSDKIHIYYYIYKDKRIIKYEYSLSMLYLLFASMLQISVYFIAFISITFNIYIFCYIGEQLCYMIEWYRLPENKARNLMFPIIMSSYPVELTAGKMVKLTMSSFSNILQTSMAYLNLLREVSSRDM
ncbi:Odorant receptor 352 [Nylanderia fulva]|uniref:Odorant receptor n=1 Tax=Nylanderia fulva TaxID=613905 RepID=A0A6G1LQL8_9HYME|nr:Odorant receptor 352 [Nylanderia fulva]